MFLRRHGSVNLTATGGLEDAEHRILWSGVPEADPEPIHAFTVNDQTYYFVDQQEVPFLGWTSRLGFSTTGTDFNLTVDMVYQTNGETGTFTVMKPDASCL